MRAAVRSVTGGRSGGDRLAVVLRLRRLDEERARLGLAAALTREADARERFTRARLEHETACAAAGALLGSAIDAAALAGAAAGLEVAERRMGTAADELTAARRNLEEARATLALATRRREAVERLRQRRLAEARRRRERQAERELTEIALVRHARVLAEAGG